MKQRHLKGERGLTLIELLIGLLLAGIVAGATFKFYIAQHDLYLAQTDISERQGNLRVAMDEISRQIRRSGYLVPATQPLRTSAKFDTLQVYIGQPDTNAIDTFTYYINRADVPPALVRRHNSQTPAIFAEGIDSVFFVPGAMSGNPQIAVALVSVQQKHLENSALRTRRRLGETVVLRND